MLDFFHAARLDQFVQKHPKLLCTVMAQQAENAITILLHKLKDAELKGVKIFHQGYF